MSRFFRKEAQPPTVLEHIRAHLDPSGCGLLPGGEQLPGTEPGDDTTVRWAPGAMDGVLSHHVGSTDPEIVPDEMIGLLGSTIGHNFRRKEFGRLYERVRQSNVLSYVDALLPAVRGSDLPPDGVHEIARRLVSEGRHVEPVKLGIALLSLFDATPEVRELLLTLGRSDELTLYCVVAFGNSDADPEQTWWALARGVDGWGRIHAVERLRDTQNPEIQDWLVREGFRNKVMYEYLAFPAATTGQLLDRLKADPDDQLLDAACEIVSALIQGGPAEDIDDYPDAYELLSVLLEVIDFRGRRLAHVVTVIDAQQFLRHDEGWEARFAQDWTPEQRSELLTTCERILSEPRWSSMAEIGLESDDDVEFWAAGRTATALGIDTFPAYLRRLRADPTGDEWFSVMQMADDSRIDEIVDLAERSLPLDDMDTGPAESLGLGPEFAGESALASILQDLGRFPGRGWNLVRVGLRSQVVRVRNMAVKTLGEWPRESWPPQAATALEAAARVEPNEEAREHMLTVLRRR